MTVFGFFKDYPSEYIRDLASIVVEKRLTRNCSIFSDGDEADWCFYVVIQGKVKIYKLSFEGKEQIIHIFGAGEPFGEVAVFEGGFFPAHAQTLETSTLYFFPRTAFISLIQKNPLLALNMLAVLSRRLRVMTSKIEELSLKEVPGRIATYLLLLSKRSNESDHVELDVTKSQLASLIGTTPETVSRIFTKLVHGDFLALDGSRITILDRSGLEWLATEGKL